MTYNLSDKDAILNYIDSRINSKKYGRSKISIYISEGFVYDISFTIGVHVLAYVDIWGREEVLNFIYEVFCKNLCKTIEREMNVKWYIKN
jgi:hypothetical protein